MSKTSWGPWWVHREIENRGPGDYLAVTATYDLFKLKMLPKLRDTFEHVLGCGRYWAADRIIEIQDPATGVFQARTATDPMWARIILRSAESGGGLESSTAKAAWLDEAGMDSFHVETWEAVLRRLALNLGRALLTTTVYNLGWLKANVFDRWQAGDPNFDVIQFDSTENPCFPREEMDRARDTMPDWRYNMMYRGIFTRPAGLIYDCFRDAPYPHGHLVPRFDVPPHWPRFLGLDFGGQNTACVSFARDPDTLVLYAYREYLAGDRTASEHARAIRAGEPARVTCIGGSPSEGQWRNEFTAAGLAIGPPDIGEVEIGIGRVYGALKTNTVLVFDDLAGTLRELRSYSRKLDSSGNPTDAIEDKSSYHRLDACRYILGWLMRPDLGETVTVARSPIAGFRGAARSGRR